MFVCRYGRLRKEKKKQVAEECCTRLGVAFDGEKIVQVGQSIWPREVVHGNDWLWMEGRMYRLGRVYGQGKLYMAMTGFRWREDCIGWAEYMAKESCTW